MDGDALQIILSVLGAETVTGALDDINQSTGELVGSFARLAGVAASLDGAFEGVRGAIELGSHLEQLSARTGQTVQDLTVLNRAFQEVGLSGDEIGLMANRLQRSLGGVNEIGQSTTQAFKDLGVDAKQLSELSFNDQLQSLAEGFSKIQSPAERASVAMQIFGRAGGQMLQLLQREGLLSQASDDAGSLAERLQRDAAGMEDVENHLTLLKGRIQEMFLAVAEQLLPALEKAGDVIKGLNLAPIGAALGSGGALALGATLATGIVSKLDTAVLSWATSTSAGAVFAENVLAPLTGGMVALFTTILPGVIAGAVGAAIIAAITEAILDGQNQVDRIREGGAHTVHSDRSRIGASRNQSQLSSARSQAQSDLAAAQKVIDELEAKQKDLDETNAAQTGTDFGSAGLALSDEDAAKLETAKKTVADLQATLNEPVNPDSIFAINKLRDANAAFEALVPTMAALQKEKEKLLLEQKDPSAQIPVLQAQRKDQVAIQNAPTAGLSDDAVKARNLQADVAILEIDKELADVNQKILEAQKQKAEVSKTELDNAEAIQVFQLETALASAKASGDTAGEQRIKDQIELLQYQKELTNLGNTDLSIAQKRVDAEHALQAVETARAAAKQNVETSKRALDEQLQGIRDQISALDADYTKTSAEKYQEKNTLLLQELTDQRAELVRLQQARSGAAQGGDTAAVANYDVAIQGQQKSIAGTQSQIGKQGPDPTSIVQNLSAAFTRLQTQWGTLQQSIASGLSGVISSGLQSVESNITKVITGAENWKQALLSIAQTIGTDVISAFVKMAVEWVANQLIMAAEGKAIATANAAAMIPIASAESAIWAAPAALATIASWGGAAIAAPGLVIAAVLATEGLAGFETGGLTPGAPGQVAGFVHGSEFVFSAPAVSAIGAANLDQLHRSALNPVSSQNSSGGGQGSSKNKGMQFIMVQDMKAAMLHAARTPEWESMHIDLNRRTIGSVVRR